MILEELKNELERLPDKNHLEIFKIFKEYGVEYSENKNGIFINLSFVENEVLDKLMSYLSKIKEQNLFLEKLENQKEEYKSLFFNEDDTNKPKIKITKNRRGRRKKKN